MSLPLYGTEAFREACGETLRPGGLLRRGHLAAAGLWLWYLSR